MRPVIGVVYDPRIANIPYHMVITRLNEFEINTLPLDCRFDNEKHLNRLVQENIELIDGLLLPGNPLDIPSELYGEARNPKWTYAKDNLLILYQAKMILEAKKRGMPILGLCQGSKVLHVIFGGKLDQDLTVRESPVKINHDVLPLKGALAHEVTVTKDTHLHDILVSNDSEARKEDLTMQVNSWHHTATKTVPENFVVNAIAPDGVIEGVEERYPGNSNCWGIQFHPEYIDKSQDPIEHERQSRIFKAFSKACLAYHHKRSSNRFLLHNFDAISKNLKKTTTEVKYSPVVIDEEEEESPRKKAGSRRI